MRDVVIISAVRTAIGAFGKSLRGVSSPHLGCTVIKDALRRATLGPTQVDEIIMGTVLQAGLGQNPARQAAIHAGIPFEVPSYTVNKVCGSGLKSVILGCQSIIAEDADIVVAGGMENMSNTPHLSFDMRWGSKPGDRFLIDSMVRDGLSCSLEGYHMGITAEHVAEKFGISREEQDQFAFQSQQKAGASLKNDIFSQEIVSVEIPSAVKGAKTFFSVDEYPKPGTTVDMLRQLKPAFKPDGTVTAGNASGINDGAAAVVVASLERARKDNLPIMARIKSYASTGVEPSLMGIGPIQAIRKALDKAGLRIDQIDLFELNEAFAAQSVAVIKELHIDPSKVNVNGGAIALGHPIGASGARILTTLLYELTRRKTRFGLAALCIGGGNGIAMIIEQL